jgi:hypothetical protein
VSRHVLCAIDDAELGQWDLALMHACIAIDGTARKLFPQKTSNRDRYITCIREYYWILEPMLFGINLEETTFPNVPLKNNQKPDLAEIIYEKFRCNDTHGEEIPKEFSLILSHDNNARWVLANNFLQMPDRIVWALLGIAVFSHVNTDEKSNSDHYLFLRHPGTDLETKFRIAEWWGREENFRPIAVEHNTLRVKLENLNFN